MAPPLRHPRQHGSEIARDRGANRLQSPAAHRSRVLALVLAAFACGAALLLTLRTDTRSAEERIEITLPEDDVDTNASAERSADESEAISREREQPGASELLGPEAEIRTTDANTLLVLLDRETSKALPDVLVTASARDPKAAQVLDPLLSPYFRSPQFRGELRKNDRGSIDWRELENGSPFLYPEGSAQRALDDGGFLARSDDGGTLRVQRLVAGYEYRLSFEKPGFHLESTSFIYSPKAAHKGHRVEVQVKAQTLGSLALRVADKEGEAMPKAAVQLERFLKATSESDSPWGIVASSDCDADGACFFGDLRPGVYRVLIGANAKMQHPILATKRIHVAAGEAEQLALRVRRVTQLKLQILVENAAPPFGYVLLDRINGRAQEPRDKKRRTKPHERNPFMDRVARHLEGGICSFPIAQAGRYDFTFTLGFAGREESFSVIVANREDEERHSIRLSKPLRGFRKGFDAGSIPLPGAWSR